MADESQDVPSWPAQLPDPATAAAGINSEGYQGALGVRMGIEYLHVAPDLVSARMPVAGNTQPYGLLHGGASGVLAESVGSVAASLNAGPGRIALGIELNLSHHRSAREGIVTAVATPLSVGRTLATYQVAITDDAGRSICTGRLTCLLREV
ncbi:MAG: 1,4-dihydroxy-2-naphthoyl-CoA hydrolase [Actinomycetota bacterium]|nr:1,4-dihydroxy-2-naphthoyl-CoA hydrolase [Actinomycetota bacterium]